VSRRPIVVKLGGRALEAAGALGELADELVGRPAVLVHGGGNEVTAWSERFGLAPRFSGGRRVTDPATLEVAAAVLGGPREQAPRGRAQGARDRRDRPECASTGSPPAKGSRSWARSAA
jgi:hypothetical protein